MKAINFVTEISKIKPNKLEIKKNTDFSDEFIDAYINDLQIVKKSTNVSISADNAIIDLIFNYDLTNLRILTVSFNKDTDTLEDDKYIYVGWAEAFPFAILKETGEIVELDWEDPTYIISYMAKDQSSFLDILIEIEKLNQKDIFGSITEKEKKASNPQPIGFSGILLAKRQNSFYCTYFLHNRNVADTKSPYPIKRLEVIRWFNQKSMVFNQSLS